MDPENLEQWMHVASTRLNEARVIHASDYDSVGSAYLAGYGVECAFKAYATLQGRKITGHDLVTLANQAGLPLRLFRNGEWFLSDWAVSWRYYQTACQLARPPAECVAAAGSLQGYIMKQINRQDDRRVKRGKS